MERRISFAEFGVLGFVIFDGRWIQTGYRLRCTTLGSRHPYYRTSATRNDEEWEAEGDTVRVVAVIAQLVWRMASRVVALCGDSRPFQVVN